MQKNEKHYFEKYGRRCISIKQLFAAADRHFLLRVLPHAMISWRYLLPNPLDMKRLRETPLTLERLQQCVNH